MERAPMPLRAESDDKEDAEDSESDEERTRARNVVCNVIFFNSSDTAFTSHWHAHRPGPWGLK